MRKIKRNIGLEILEGIREIKHGEHGHITTVPSITAIRGKTGLSQAQFERLWASRFERFKSGNKAAARPPVRLEHC